MGSLLAQNPEVVLREESAEGGLLFHADTKAIKVLNSTGLAIWQLCDGTRDFEAILKALETRFKNIPDESTLREDVSEFVQTMLQAQFLGEQS